MKILVLSTFDIFPANDGGRMRYTSIYRAIAQDNDVQILAYHLSAGALTHTKRYWLQERLEVVVVPASQADEAMCWDNYSRTSRIAHDILCIRSYGLSDEFRKTACAMIGAADVVIAAHPYLFLVASRYAKRDAVIVYESFNVEYDAKVSHLEGMTDHALKTSLLADVEFIEGLACRQSHYVTAVSASDADRLAQLYGIPRSRITVIPNGVDTMLYPSIAPGEKDSFRRRMGTHDRICGVFVGSGYAPNVASYRRARRMLAEAGFTGVVVLVGSIDAADRSDWEPVAFGEIWLGFVDESLRVAVLSSADFALQLLFEGAGTNLKLFDYMASHTLIVANAFGARGVDGRGWHYPVPDVETLRRFLNDRPWTTKDGARIVTQARTIAEREFDWRTIARRFLILLEGRFASPLSDKKITQGSAASRRLEEV